MTHPPTSDGDIHVSDTFSADEPQKAAEPREGAAESTPVSDALPRTSDDDTAVQAADFDIDFGQGEYHRSADDDLGIDLDFGAGTAPAAGAVAGEGEGIDLNFGEPEPEDEDEDDEEEESEAGTNALEAFRSELRAKLGDWYVVHTYSGMENRVKANLENRKVSLNMEEYIHDVVVPVEEVAEIKNGQRRMVKRTVLPGYVLVRMDLTDESWAAVRHTPSVTGFVGHSHQPVPLSLAEVESMLAPTIEAAAAVAPGGGGDAASTKKSPKVEFTDFAPSDSVMVVDGPFATLHATITEINVDAQRVKALVEIFGRETPVELSFTQIQRV